MAAGCVSNRPGKVFDYVQLNPFSSVVLYDTKKQQEKKSVFYEVESSPQNIVVICYYKRMSWPDSNIYLRTGGTSSMKMAMEFRLTSH